MNPLTIFRQSAEHLDLPGNLMRSTAELVDFDEIDSDTLSEIIKGLFHVLYVSDGGVGLAAPMVGVDLSIVAIDIQNEDTPPFVLINPEIVNVSEETETRPEANLCLPEIAAKVERPKSITVRAFDQHGQKSEKQYDDFLARIVLHEIDVLNGKMFHDYVSPEEIVTVSPEKLSSKAVAKIYDDGSDDSQEQYNRAHYLNPVTVGPPLLDIPYSVLRKKPEPIDFSSWEPKQLRKLVDDMVWLQHYLEGVGIAAPQVGLSVQMTVIDNRQDPPYVLINPTITEMSEETEVGLEGCLSIPYYRGPVERSKKIKVEAFDVNGEPFHLDAEDFLARIIQHEVDHLNGILFTDRLATSDSLISLVPSNLTSKTMHTLYP